VGKHGEQLSGGKPRQQPWHPAPDPPLGAFRSCFLQKPAVNAVHVLPRAPAAQAARGQQPRCQPRRATPRPPARVGAEGTEGSWPHPSLGKEIFSLTSGSGSLEVLNPPGGGLARELFLAEVGVVPQVFPLVLGSG